MRELPAEDRPRERLLRHGAQALSTPELLAILLRTGNSHEDVLQVATRLFVANGGLRGLAALDLVSLLGEKTGIGPAKATTLQAAFELGRRLAMEPPQVRDNIRKPADIERLLLPEMELLQHEELRILILDTKHHVTAAPTLYRGALNSSPARVAEVFREAVRRNAYAIAIAHNHPSGDPTPSADDIAFTEAVVEAGSILGIEVLDHLVIGHGRSLSLRDGHLGFK